MKTFVGLVLLGTGTSLFLLSFFNITKIDTVIDSSFILEPDGKMSYTIIQELSVNRFLREK